MGFLQELSLTDSQVMGNARVRRERAVCHGSTRSQFGYPVVAFSTWGAGVVRGDSVESRDALLRACRRGFSLGKMRE